MPVDVKATSMSVLPGVPCWKFGAIRSSHAWMASWNMICVSYVAARNPASSAPLPLYIDPGDNGNEYEMIEPVHFAPLFSCARTSALLHDSAIFFPPACCGL